MKEYKDPDVLMQMHWDEDKSLREMGREFDVSHRTIGYWFDKHDLTRRGTGGEYPYARLYTESEHSGSAGYELWKFKTDGETKRFRVHRLLAIAEYGVDAVENMTVHHKNGIKWDNRPENIELLSNEEHSKLHAEEQRESGEPFWNQ